MWLRVPLLFSTTAFLLSLFPSLYPSSLLPSVLLSLLLSSSILPFLPLPSLLPFSVCLPIFPSVRERPRPCQPELLGDPSWVVGSSLLAVHSVQVAPARSYLHITSCDTHKSLLPTGPLWEQVTPSHCTGRKSGLRDRE